MNRLIILRGVSGSGKSTWAEAYEGPQFMVVSRDRIRAAFFPNFNDQEYYQSPLLRDMEDSVTRIQHEAIRSGLDAGKSVIVDNTNVQWKFVKEIAEIGYRANVPVEVRVFDVPLREALIRNAKRAENGGRFVPVDVIHRQHKSLESNKHMLLEQYAYEPVEQNYLADAVLVDIDGTLAHMSGRSPYEWARVGEDTIDENVKAFVYALYNAGYTIILLSGRDGSCRVETEDWLERHGVPYDFLLMREAGDNRKDSIVKYELFNEHVRDKYGVLCVLDDRQQVVDMWRHIGLTCLQVAEGNF